MCTKKRTFGSVRDNNATNSEQNLENPVLLWKTRGKTLDKKNRGIFPVATVFIPAA